MRIRLFSKQPEVQQADILNLQEVHTYDMLWALQHHLSSFPYMLYKPGLLGPRAGLVTFSKQPLQTKAFVPLGLHKGMLVSELSSGLVIANSHLIANIDGDWSKENRFYPRHKVQLDTLNSFLHQSHFEGRVIVLTGDFNIDKTSDLYSYFVKKGSWQDTAKGNFSPTFHQGFLSPNRQARQIDYIFTRGNINILDTAQLFKNKVSGTYLSDHLGLSAHLEV